MRGVLAATVTVVLRTAHEPLTNSVGKRATRRSAQHELAPRGRCGYVGLFVAVRNMVIDAVALALTLLEDLPHGPLVDPIAEGEHRG